MIFWARPRFEWQLRTRSVPLGECTRIVAHISLTHTGMAGADQHRAAWAKVAVAHAVQAVDAGADIVELGVEHRPAGRFPHLTAAQEQARLLPVLEGLLMERPEAIVCVEVRHAETANAALLAGAEILTGLSSDAWNQAVARVVVQSGCGLVLQHRPGSARDRSRPRSSRDEIVPNVFAGLCEQLMLAEAAGIDAEQIVADPGVGVAQQGAAEFVLLAGLGRLRQLDRPLMVGPPLSPAPRSGSTEPGPVSPAAAVAGHVAAVLAGVHLLRVHDVAAARAAAEVADAVLEAEHGAAQQ